MKWLLALTPLYLCVSASALEEHYVHPLQTYIDQVQKLATTLAATDATGDEDLRVELAHLRARTAELAERALLAPVRADALKLARLGYDLTKTNNLNTEFRVDQNAGFATLADDVKRLEPARWAQVAQMAAKSRETILGTQKLLYADGIKDLLTPDRWEAATGLASFAHEQSLMKLEDYADSTSSCITYFKDAYRKFGVRPKLVGTQYAWSTDDLRARFHVKTLADLPAPKRAEVKASLVDLSEKAHYYYNTCVSVDEMAFLIDEEGALKP